MKFKCFKLYYKQYRIFKNPYVVNVGTYPSLVDENKDLEWIKANTDIVIENKDPRCNEFLIIYEITQNFAKYGVNDNDLIMFQAYSKVMDLNRLSCAPYKDLCQKENINGEKYYQNAEDLSIFGYNDNTINYILNNFDCIGPTQYPCSFNTAITGHLSIDGKYKQQYIYELCQLLNKKFNGTIFNINNVKNYLKCGYQYWRGNGVFRALHWKYILEVTKYFYDNTSEELNKQMYDTDNSPISRRRGLFLELAVGFGIYCIMTLNFRKIYAPLYTDNTVTFTKLHERH